TLNTRAWAVSSLMREWRASSSPAPAPRRPLPREPATRGAPYLGPATQKPRATPRRAAWAATPPMRLRRGREAKERRTPEPPQGPHREGRHLLGACHADAQGHPRQGRVGQDVAHEAPPAQEGEGAQQPAARAEEEAAGQDPAGIGAVQEQDQRLPGHSLTPEGAEASDPTGAGSERSRPP